MPATLSPPPGRARPPLGPDAQAPAPRIPGGLRARLRALLMARQCSAPGALRHLRRLDRLHREARALHRLCEARDRRDEAGEMVAAEQLAGVMEDLTATVKLLITKRADDARRRN